MEAKRRRTLAGVLVLAGVVLVGGVFVVLQGQGERVAVRNTNPNLEVAVESGDHLMTYLDAYGIWEEEGVTLSADGLADRRTPKKLEIIFTAYPLGDGVKDEAGDYQVAHAVAMAGDTLEIRLYVNPETITAEQLSMAASMELLRALNRTATWQKAGYPDTYNQELKRLRDSRQAFFVVQPRGSDAN